MSRLCPAHNKVQASQELLARTLDAFERIAVGEMAPERRGETRVYRFEGFGVRLRSHRRDRDG